MSKTASTVLDTIPIAILATPLNSPIYLRPGGLLAVAPGVLLLWCATEWLMFKISIVETSALRRLVLEGKLLPPCTKELERAWKTAGEQLKGRKLIVDLTNVTLIGREGEDTLFKLMREGAKFCCGDVFTKHVVKELARKFRCPE